MKLPEIDYSDPTLLDSALRHRQSIRKFTAEPLTIKQVSSLLWATHGLNVKEGRPTVPSAGALYPLEIYFVAANVHDLPAGIYRYDYHAHQLEPMLQKALIRELTAACYSQNWISRAAGVIVIAAVYERTTRKYGARGERYVHIEAGHAAQNVYLKAAALGLGTTEVGAFDDDVVQKVLGLPTDIKPLAILPLGKP